ncbi:Major facilitator superfamily MFS_1 [Bradyrhizobium sp. STM 3843]|uniref:MFS transporter n=1 Tax=Bradyrhizobium sp. STM 3843 TaxID=551947 RepID=UPI000240775E|nr:MFS transporter [Bradyrhizobium sp. STM 3843]CCE07294.1 Major facilitator superfamily MFS_1 [Bradyrhizobium sp. STM 3843]
MSVVAEAGAVTAATTSISVQSGARLDRLPISAFHKRIFWLIGAGMFFDGYDLYVGTSVLGATLASKFSTLAQNAQFVSFTFFGMTVGALVAGFLGDAYGRRFTYQFNLLLFGIASLGAAVAPSMEWLVAARFLMGLGLGAEIVVGYSSLTEFVPPASRGKWLALMAMIVVSGLPATILLASILIPLVGWRAMFVIAGVGALIVWYLRKSLPESPRWLESKGRAGEAEALVAEIERECGGASLPPARAAAPVRSYAVTELFGPVLLPRLILGSIVLIVINTLIFGFVTWLPTFFVQQGVTLTKSFAYTLIMSFAAPIGCALGAFLADRLGRRMTIVSASVSTIVFGLIYPMLAEPVAFVAIGFCLLLSIYVLVALLYGVYTPELFPTEVRLRANGICNMLGRGATIVSPFMVVGLFKSYGVSGVTSLMVGLLAIQIAAVLAWGIEPAKRGLEELSPQD